MNKSEIVEDFKEKGMKLEDDSKWQFVEEREFHGHTAKIYSANLRDGGRQKKNIELAVVNEGQTNEEGKVIETVTALKELQIPFLTALFEAIDDMEENDDKIFAIELVDLSETSEVAKIKVYNINGNNVSEEIQIARRRNNLFEFKKLEKLI